MLNEKAQELTKHVVGEFIDFYIKYFENGKNIVLNDSEKEKIRDYVLRLDTYTSGLSINQIDNMVANRIAEWVSNL